jgi:hypothetical protein
VTLIQEECALGWCREKEYERVILHASKGRPLHEDLMLGTTNEMILKPIRTGIMRRQNPNDYKMSDGVL